MTTSRIRNRFTAENSALLLIDHQVEGSKNPLVLKPAL